MAIEAGRMTSRLIVERLIEVDGGMDGATTIWSEIGRRWAAARVETGRERMYAGRIESTSQAVFTLRRCTLTIGLTGADRFNAIAGPHRGKIWRIVSSSVHDDDDAIDFLCEHVEGEP